MLTVASDEEPEKTSMPLIMTCLLVLLVVVIPTLTLSPEIKLANITVTPAGMFSAESMLDTLYGLRVIVPPVATPALLTVKFPVILPFCSSCKIVVVTILLVRSRLVNDVTGGT